MVTASSAENADQCEKPCDASHWILPRGRAAAMLSANSTPMEAETRRLSAVAHIQRLFGSAASGDNETRMSPCPAAFTLFGASSDDGVSETCSPASALEICARSAGWSNCRFSEKRFPWKTGACKNCTEGS